jgi:sn1-specific diacylglycerol lipase
MYIVSGRGAPTFTEPREKPLKRLCYIHLTIFHLLILTTFFFGITATSLLERFCRCIKIEPAFVQDKLEEEDHKLKDVCENYDAWFALFVGLTMTHFLDAVYVCFTILYFGCKSLPSLPALLSKQAQWTCCCRCCFGVTSLFTCCLYGGTEAVRGDLSDFALLMANHFEDDGILDVTASDILAALLMLKRCHLQEDLESRDQLLVRLTQQESNENDTEPQQQEMTAHKHHSSLPSLLPNSLNFLKQERHLAVLTQSWSPGQSLTFHHRHRQEGSDNETTGPFAPVIRETLSEKNPYERYLVAEGARFICISKAIYAWSAGSSYRDEIGRAIAAQFRVSRQDDRELELDRYRRLLSLAPVHGIQEKDIVVVKIKQGIAATPYAIVVDHSWKSVVIAIRGTQSLEDWLVDITMRPDELAEIGQECGFDGVGRYCHAGVLACTEWIYRDLERCVNTELI